MSLEIIEAIGLVVFELCMALIGSVLMWFGIVPWLDKISQRVQWELIIIGSFLVVMWPGAAWYQAISSNRLGDLVVFYPLILMSLIGVMTPLVFLVSCYWKWRRGLSDSQGWSKQMLDK